MPERFACPHDHDYSQDAHRSNERRTWIVIGLTVTTMVVEILCGLFLRRTLESSGDATVDDLHVWRVGPGCYSAGISLTSRDGMTPHEAKRRLSGFPQLVHVTVEVNTPGFRDASRSS